MRSLFYVYASTLETSFREISRFHIFHLSRYTKVQPVEEDVLDNIQWVGSKRVLLHPILYPLMGDKPEHYAKRIPRFKKLQAVSVKLGGFETADTDRLSERATDILNHFNLVFLPSRWAYECFKRSGVYTKLEILPHGLPDAFLMAKRTITSYRLYGALNVKRKYNAIYVLFNLLHSGYRKGADLVAKVMKRIQNKYPKVFLLLKRGKNIDPFVPLLTSLKTVEVAGWLNEDEYRQLFDLADIAVCPSRGGGFEINAIEALARGVPTLVPNAGCFLDYIEYAVPVETRGGIRVFPNNPVHVGTGFEVDLRDFQEKLEGVIANLSEYKRKAERNAYAIRKRYSWRRVCDQLYKKLKFHGFVD